MRQEPIENVFAFAVASGLELYLAEELDKNKPWPLLSSSILHLAVNPPLFDENNDQAAILKLLLDGGVDLKTIYNGETAFQMLWSFKHICPATVVEVFLAHHQDPNVKIKYQERITKRQWVDRWQPGTDPCMSLCALRSTPSFRLCFDTLLKLMHTTVKVRRPWTGCLRT